MAETPSDPHERDLPPPWDRETAPAPGCAANVAIAPARLTDRQYRYVHARAQGHDRARAAIIAGIAPGLAYAQAAKWEGNDAIREAIEAAQVHVHEKVQWKPEDVFNEFAIIAFATLDDYLIDEQGQLQLSDEAPPHAMRAVQSFERKVTYDEEGNITYHGKLRLYDKQTALNKLGEFFGMWLKRVRVEEDGEVKATLNAMRKTMEQVQQLQQQHQAEDARIAEFQRTVDRAGQTVAGSAQPISMLRAMAESVARTQESE